MLIEEILPQEEIAQLGQLWHLEPPFSLIRKTANAVFRSDQTVIKLTAPFRRSLESIRAQLEWVAYLHQRHVPVVAPIPSTRGSYVENLQGLEEPLTASAFEWAAGHPPGDADLNPTFLQTLGRALGSLHTASTGYTTDSHFDDWRAHIWPTLDRYRALPVDPRPADQLEEIAAELAKRPKRPREFGPCHGDLHPDNLFVGDNGAITLFDFEACCTHWYIYDFATTALHTTQYFHRLGLSTTYEAVRDALYAGYGRPLPLDDLPLFTTLRALTVFCWGTVQLHTRPLDQAGRTWIDQLVTWLKLYLE